jgi:Fur family transcriptional regulator, ferric uptake regulator
MPLQPLPSATEPGIIEPLCAVFRRKLRSEGLKYTPERARVLDAIVRTEEPFEAEGLIGDLKSAGARVSKATVYRTIKLLQEAGIIQRILFEGDQSRYQLVYGLGASALIVRLDSGEVESVHVPELIQLRDRICRERGLQARAHHLQVFAIAANRTTC